MTEASKVCPLCRGTGTLEQATEVPVYVQDAQRALELARTAYRADHEAFVMQLRSCGWTLDRISDIAGISRERARLIEKMARERPR